MAKIKSIADLRKRSVARQEKGALSEADVERVLKKKKKKLSGEKGALSEADVKRMKRAY